MKRNDIRINQHFYMMLFETMNAIPASAIVIAIIIIKIVLLLLYAIILIVVIIVITNLRGWEPSHITRPIQQDCFSERHLLRIIRSGYLHMIHTRIFLFSAF